MKGLIRNGLKASNLLAVLVLVSVLAGCVNNPSYRALEGPVRDSSASASAASSGSAPSGSDASGESDRPAGPQAQSERPDRYRVQRGDTLYSIAFRFGLDYRGLARANNIGSDYTIYVGQSLALREAGAPAATDRPSQSSSSSPSGGDSSVTKNNSQESGANETDAASVSVSDLEWQWPHDGKIVRTFNANVSDRKGVDLTGQIGDSVRAAAEGVVVYAGNGLPGYGNLIILEHHGSLLSAYAYNEELLVEERDRVQPGEEIARMGRQGDQPRLHFEIRREGKPVDPQGYLPRR